MICRTGVRVTKSTKSQKWKHCPLVVKSTQFKENTVESERGNCTKVWLKARTTTRTQQDHLTPPPLEATPPPAKPTRLRLIFLQFRWFPTGALRCSAALAGRGGGHVYMAPCRSSSRCSRCRRRSCRESTASAASSVDPGPPADRRQLTLSFLNSSYSGLSVGSSSLHSGQVLVCGGEGGGEYSQRWAVGRTCRGPPHVVEPGQDAGGVEEVFAGHLVQLLLPLELQ